MKKYGLVFFIILVNHYKPKAQDSISWNPNYKLKWEDFKGVPDTTSKFQAISFVNIGYKLSFTDTSYKYKIICYFIKNKSWRNSSNNILLSHEQGHFNIGEIFTRKMRQAFSQYKSKPDATHSYFSEQYNKLKLERAKMNEQYDRETNYSKNLEMQIIWLKRIDDQLNNLSSFKSN